MLVSRLNYFSWTVALHNSEITVCYPRESGFNRRANTVFCYKTQCQSVHTFRCICRTHSKVRNQMAITQLFSVLRQHPEVIDIHVPLCVCVCVCVCVRVSALSTFECVNESLWNLVCISLHLSPSQRHNSRIPPFSLCDSVYIPSIFATQRLGAPTNTRAIIEELLALTFSIRLVLYQRKNVISSSQKQNNKISFYCATWWSVRLNHVVDFNKNVTSSLSWVDECKYRM
jgi:hypothetical protein